MGVSIQQVRAQLKELVAPYLKTQASGLGFAIGYASPDLSAGDIFCAGNIETQLGSQRDVDPETAFEIASVTKTFTATLYALLLRTSPSHKVGDYCAPQGALPIGETLGEITLESLVNYTSGLPDDNEDAASSTPPYLPRPYSMAGLMSYLSVSPPEVLEPGKKYSYSNLAFAVMAAILTLNGSSGVPTTDAFVSKMRERIFKPLGLRATFFDEVSLKNLPLGYYYDYTKTDIYEAWRSGWDFFPAYYGAGGIVASPSDMLQWLLFNMGLAKGKDVKGPDGDLTRLLPALLMPSTEVLADGNNVGLGWFINPERPGWSASVFKDGGLDEASSYIALVPSDKPGTDPSRAGAFVLVNARGITDTQTKEGTDIAVTLTNDLLFILQGKTPPADKSSYPKSILKAS